MYDYIIGHVSSITKESVTLETNGIGYKIYATSATVALAHEKSGPIKLYVSFIVREFAHSLFGFFTLQERELFETLLNISGIGPKIALAMIGHIAPSLLIRAIAEKDIPTLCKIPGIGKKTAERLLVELKDVLPSFQFENREDSETSIGKDAVSALINLGYTQITARKAVKKAIEKSDHTTELSTLIALALQEVG